MQVTQVFSIAVLAIHDITWSGWRMLLPLKGNCNVQQVHMGVMVVCPQI